MSTIDTHAAPVDELQASLADAQKRFLAMMASLRPRLHRFCSRVSGSVLDGEDLVQESLAQAFYKLPLLTAHDRLEPWLFRIAHRKCIDFLRRRRVTHVPFDEDLDDGVSPEVDLVMDEQVGEALMVLVTQLPPKERACVVLKDVLGYSLADIADIVESTVGGVKAALHRGRRKLRTLQPESSTAEIAADKRALLELYLDRFNRKDWDGVRDLLCADARLEVVERGLFQGVDAISASYMRNYTALPARWKFALARVDGEPMAVQFREIDGAWTPHSILALDTRDGKIAAIRDFVHVPYVLEHARVAW